MRPRKKPVSSSNRSWDLQDALTRVVTTIIFSATLIYNPIVYAIIDTRGVHFVYVFFAIVFLVLGILFSSSFRPRRDTDISSEVTCTTNSIPSGTCVLNYTLTALPVKYIRT